MRLTQKLVMLGAVALAVLGMSASSASATVEIVHEETSEHCNPCLIHYSSVGDIDIESHVAVPGMEIVASRCELEFEGEIYENGEGHIYNQMLTGSGCTTTPCPSTEWPFHIREDAATHAEMLTVTLCFVRAGTVIACTVSFAVNSSTHTLGITAAGAPCVNLGGAVEITGSAVCEHDTHESIEVIH